MQKIENAFVCSDYFAIMLVLVHCREYLTVANLITKSQVALVEILFSLMCKSGLALR